MILRKPYAILIKYFKIIHILMFVFFSYIVFVLRKIYSFFREYVQTSNFTYFEDMATRYVPIVVFFMVIIMLALAVGVFYLMRKKDKPVLFYKLLIGYCSILLIVFIYYFVFFKSLDDTIYEPLRVVVNRDIVLFIYIINFFFVAFTFIRGFGFDIKKFSFDKDKKELNLEESDSEEYELNVNIEKEDIVNYLNKQKREFKYYLKENSFVLSIIGAVVLVGIILFVYLNFFVYNKTYHENEDVNIGKLVYKVSDSYIVNYDKYGKKLSSESDYLIVYLNVINNLATGYLDSEALRVHVDDEYYYPLTSSCDMFSDMGECYKNQQLNVNTQYNYILAYKIKKEHQKIYLEILKDKSDEYKYSKVLLSTKSFERKEENYKLNEQFIIENNSYQVNSYSIDTKASYDYQECIDEKCNTVTKLVSPKIGEIVLTIDISNIDNLSDDIIKNAFGLKINDKTIYGNTIKYLDKYENKIYLSVPNSVKNVSKLILTITTRTKLYNIELGGWNE